MIKFSLFIFLLTLPLDAFSSDKKFEKHYANDVIGLSFDYKGEFTIKENKNKKGLQISIGDWIGNTLNGGVSINIGEMNLKNKSYEEYLTKIKNRYKGSDTQNIIKENDHLISKKYKAKELITESKSELSLHRGYSLFIKSSKPNKMLRIYMITDPSFKIEIYKKRMNKAIEQYNHIVRTLKLSNF